MFLLSAKSAPIAVEQSHLCNSCLFSRTRFIDYSRKSAEIALLSRRESTYVELQCRWEAGLILSKVSRTLSSWENLPLRQTGSRTKGSSWKVAVVMGSDLFFHYKLVPGQQAGREQLLHKVLDVTLRRVGVFIWRPWQKDKTFLN